MYEPGDCLFFFTSSVFGIPSPLSLHTTFVSYDVLARVALLKASAFSSAYLGTSGRGHSGG